MRKIVSSITFALVLVVTTHSAQALTCGTYSTNQTMTANLDVLATQSHPCITLTNGADLNLGGYTLKCKVNPSFPGVTICNSMVRATATNSIVQNGTIVADATQIILAVDDATQVKDLNIYGINNGEITTAIESLDIAATKVQGNVIRDVVVGISVSMPANGSEVMDNFVELRGDEDITVGVSVLGSTSSDGPRVINNLITNHVIGIAADPELEIRVLNNILCGGRTDDDDYDPLFVDPLHTVTGNQCSERDPVDDCEIAPPYVMP
jgi:hypothetical protein